MTTPKQEKQRFYYLMDLHYSQTNLSRIQLYHGFTTLWIYTILKRTRIFRNLEKVLLPYGFTLFSNSALASLNDSKFYYLMDLHYSQTINPVVLWAVLFYYLMDLHYSQTNCYTVVKHTAFYYLMDLHYSQTPPIFAASAKLFYYLMDLHYSQTLQQFRNIHHRFTTLWIYTILKPPLMVQK